MTDRGVDLDAVSEVLQQVRRAKTEAKRSQRAEVAEVAVTAPPGAAAAALDAARDDLSDALTIGVLSVTTTDALTVDITLD